ncbi:hypothetical protein [Achromobacter insuavis]|uniref:Uncharacterized protein n=1 Tax=Achromobacter insuavis AXX-A TaxID=1003200 RepID=F7SXD3_9BURK|nr:hypothetical protein [Achromobacter insuavis]EGP47470.1 hypothetical protein AXXA_06943 [Achromobacter insuavis AXX-A]
MQGASRSDGNDRRGRFNSEKRRLSDQTLAMRGARASSSPRRQADADAQSPQAPGRASEKSSSATSSEASAKASRMIYLLG